MLKVNLEIDGDGTIYINGKDMNTEISLCKKCYNEFWGTLKSMGIVMKQPEHKPSIRGKV